MDDVPIEETRTGEVLGGRYVVGALIGKGGHGEVYRARDIIDQRDVALKFLAAHLAQDNEYRLRLVREARAISALGASGTLEIMGVVGAEDGTPCLIMELLEGHDLAREIRQRNSAGEWFSAEDAVQLFMPVVQTLDAAHARDIIHRDIKPSNIFLVGGALSDPRLMDFGLAKSGDLAVITADRMLAGSPSYIAPEIWSHGARIADQRSDVYSLSAVIFETLAGQVPIWRADLAQMLVAVTTASDRPSLHAKRSDLPEAIDDWTAQSLAVDPDQRFQSVVAMWRAFRTALGA
jgi:eukaryotic-like serine/threonine-protein kinase